ncbi:hypothetical protein EW146_g5818 [Bondarzewia mesenterica]|uniref:Uncharacterized protein n=1 Tax=Bondarzewia mesenterica TaxID=1095465 RepID=A0A4S4LS64_9AGAM|nr:hypothetical protein EW146_g5818 [Bondarzewia mesenterica]
MNVPALSSAHDTTHPHRLRTHPRRRRSSHAKLAHAQLSHPRLSASAAAKPLPQWAFPIPSVRPPALILNPGPASMTMSSRPHGNMACVSRLLLTPSPPSHSQIRLALFSFQSSPTLPLPAPASIVLPYALPGVASSAGSRASISVPPSFSHDAVSSPCPPFPLKLVLTIGIAMTSLASAIASTILMNDMRAQCMPRYAVLLAPPAPHRRNLLLERKENFDMLWSPQSHPTPRKPMNGPPLIISVLGLSIVPTLPGTQREEILSLSVRSIVTSARPISGAFFSLVIFLGVGCTNTFAPVRAGSPVGGKRALQQTSAFELEERDIPRHGVLMTDIQDFLFFIWGGGAVRVRVIVLLRHASPRRRFPYVSFVETLAFGFDTQSCVVPDPLMVQETSVVIRVRGTLFLPVGWVRASVRQRLLCVVSSSVSSARNVVSSFVRLHTHSLFRCPGTLAALRGFYSVVPSFFFFLHGFGNLPDERRGSKAGSLADGKRALQKTSPFDFPDMKRPSSTHLARSGSYI